MALTQVKTSGLADDAVTLAKQAAGTDGQIITYDASGNPSAVGPGTDGQVLTSTGAGSPPAFEAIPAGGAATNLIINGDMQVAQRGTAAVAETGYKSVDRWQLGFGGHDEALNQQQVDVSVGSSPYNLPVGSGHPYAHGFRKCFQVQNGNQTSGADAADYCQIVYRPEGQDINRSGWNYTDPNSKITLSFWVKSSVAQNFYGFIEAGSPTRIFGWETGTLVAHTWTKITKVIPGYASLVIPDTTASAFSLAIIPFYGTGYTAASGRDVGTWYEAYNYLPNNTSTWWTTNDATFQVTGVQLETGDTASDFAHKLYADELRRCQRYYVVWADHSQAGGDEPIGCAFFNNGTYKYYADCRFPVEMRANASVIVANTSNAFRTYADGAGENCSTLSSDQLTKRVARIGATTALDKKVAGLRAQTNGYLHFNAEL